MGEDIGVELVHGVGDLAYFSRELHLRILIVTDFIHDLPDVLDYCLSHDRWVKDWSVLDIDQAKETDQGLGLDYDVLVFHQLTNLLGQDKVYFRLAELQAKGLELLGA